MRSSAAGGFAYPAPGALAGRRPAAATHDVLDRLVHRIFDARLRGRPAGIGRGLGPIGKPAWVFEHVVLREVHGGRAPS